VSHKPDDGWTERSTISERTSSGDADDRRIEDDDILTAPKVVSLDPLA
jgi:hypothetical protein